MESLAAAGSPAVLSWSLWSCKPRMPSKCLGSSSKGELIKFPAQCLILDCSKNHLIGAEPEAVRRKDGVSRQARRLNAAISGPFSSPKTGTLGEDRFKDGAVPGTYWNDSLDLGEKTTVCFNTGSNRVVG